VWKGCQPNWEHNEILALVKAKWDEHITGLNVIDGQDKFEVLFFTSQEHGRSNREGQ
jgi:predicted HAD superfamily hydrolase